MTTSECITRLRQHEGPRINDVSHLCAHSGIEGTGSGKRYDSIPFDWFTYLFLFSLIGRYWWRFGEQRRIDRRHVIRVLVWFSFAGCIYTRQRLHRLDWCSTSTNRKLTISEYVFSVNSVNEIQYSWTEYFNKIKYIWWPFIMIIIIVIIDIDAFIFHVKSRECLLHAWHTTPIPIR